MTLLAALLLEPDFCVDASGDVLDGPVLVEGERIAAVGAAARGARAQRVPLAGRFLAPAFANAHSHSFQRALRGRVEARTPGKERDDFWTWRHLMYQASLSLDVDDVEAIAAWCFLDMLRAGYGAAGEFHYVHHRPDGTPYDDGLALSRAIARAAATTGIRLVLIQTAYERAGAGRPPLEGQRRFCFATVEAFLEHARAARAASYPGARISHALAFHSVRACSRPWIEAISSSSGGLPLHAHACEQRGEIASCREEHGVAPLELIERCGALGPRTTVVHGTHLEPGDVERLARARSTVCLCPSTERNLGDGMCPISDLARAGVPLAVGTDSHARLDVADELRSLEDHERLRLERRNVLAPERGSLRHGVLAAGTANGMRALGLDGGTLSPGANADLVAISAPLEHAASPGAAVDAWLVGGSGRDVSDVMVGGELVVVRGQPARCSRADVEAAAKGALSRLTARG